MDTSIKAYFGGDTSGLRAAAQDATGIVDRLAKNIAHKFSGRDLARTLTTAIGLNIDSIADKIVAPFREAAESAKTVAEYTEKTATATEALIRMRQTAEQQLVTLANKQRRLTEESKNTAGEASIWNRYLGIGLLQLGFTTAAAKLLGNEQANIEKAARDALALQENALEFERVRQEVAKRIAQGQQEAAKRQQDLANAINKALDKSVALDKQLFEQKLDRMKPEERLLALERERNELVAVQKTTTKGSNDYKELQIDINNTNKRIESERLDIAKQTAAAEKEITAQKAEQRSGGSFITSKNLSLASDAELQALADKYAKASFEAEQKARSQGGFPGSQAAFQIEQGTADANRSAVERELRFRGAFRMDAAFGGEANARRNFQGDPLAFDRLYQQLVTGQTDLQKQNDRLIDVLTKQGIITRDPPGSPPRG